MNFEGFVNKRKSCGSDEVTPLHLPVGVEGTLKNLIIVGVAPKIRTGHLSNTSYC
jgi:hypothetical protein